MLTLTEINNIENGYYFNEEKLIGKGVGGSVYTINDNYVVKNIRNSNINEVYNNSFKLELETTIVLSCIGITPKVVYHSSKKDKYTYFVMERMDYTLYYMLKNRIFLKKHLVKLSKILDKLNNTEYRHEDLHLNNIMWCNKLDDFRIIDWGVFYKTKNIQKYKQSPKLLKKIDYWLNNSFRIFRCFGIKICRIKL